ncbi:MAG: 50S ribosomal protein L32 [Chloroflexota bacterium]|nr:50S ribosomal protein L32 [Chloroflexota bacterium]MDE2687541.1 50S ribosomal protein L32 [Chloroflexota bacterium]
MPPLPKKKHSKGRQGGRKAHFGMKPLTLTQCPQCPEMQLPHRACPVCGYYNGRTIATGSNATGSNFE